MTHAEGKILRDAVKKTGRILQVGSQQRSWGPNEQFRKGVEAVRSGHVGQLRRVEIGLPIDPTAPDNPPEPVPAGLNYDMWLGPTPEVYYTEQRVHPQGMGRDGTPDVASRPGWLRNENYSLGMITGGGAHHFDTAHWGMNTELTGPLKIEGRGEFPTNKIWNVHGKYHIELEYAGGIKMTVSDELPNGIKFIGDDGWIWVSRDGGPATASDPAVNSGTLRSLDASDKRLLDPTGLSVQLPHSISHHNNWLECVQSRKTPLAPAPVAHRSNAACILSWIAMKTGRPLRWDPVAEDFINDKEASAMLSRPSAASTVQQSWQHLTRVENFGKAYRESITVKTRKLGSLEVSALGLGCMGMSEFYGATNDAESLRTIHRSLELGCTFLDTADVYGPYLNEELIARAVSGRRLMLSLHQVCIVRDVGAADEVNKRTINNRPEYVRKSCEASLARLKTDYIDLYYLHRIDPDTPIEDSVGELARLVEEGKIRHIGLSEMAPDTLRRAQAVHAVAAVQVEYSLWTRDPEADVLGVCRELGVGLVPYSPLGRGFLTGTITASTELAANDFRRFSPRFDDDNLNANLALVDVVKVGGCKNRVQTGTSRARVGARAG